MSNESKPGFKGKVTLGANMVLGLGVWSHTGFNVDLLDNSEFGTDYDDFMYGMTHCGKVTFNGNFKKDDTQGQDFLRSAMIANYDITDIRFYVDSVSYYTPNNTTAAGGGLPAETPIGHAIVESVETTFDKGDLGKVSFSVQLANGPLRLI